MYIALSGDNNANADLALFPLCRERARYDSDFRQPRDSRYSGNTGFADGRRASTLQSAARGVGIEAGRLVSALGKEASGAPNSGSARPEQPALDFP